MIKKTAIRTGFAGVLALAILGGSVVTAQADTTENPYFKGTFYLADANTYQDLAPGDPIPWDTPVIAIPAPGDFEGKIYGESDPTTTGIKTFWSQRGEEANPNLWNASATNGFPADGKYSWMANVTPTSQIDAGFERDPKGQAAIKAAGGEFSVGIAFTKYDHVAISDDGLWFIHVNVQAGTGTWSYQLVEVDVPVELVDVETTTTLAVDPTSVEAGKTATLTASVSAIDKTVTGNVEFFKGSTSLGAVALAGGQATKTVIVGSVGEHGYTAKYKGATVGTDRFLTSDSAEVTVTGTPSEVPYPPAAPSESALNENTANGASATIDAADKVTMTVDASFNGKTVNVFAYSTPTFLGRATVTAGSVTVDASVLASGDHKLAITDPDTGDVLGWAAFTKATAAVSPSITKQINAEVAALEPSDGEFSLINLSGDTVTLANPAIVNGQSVTSGELGSFKVTDLRQVSKPGWTLGTSVAQFKLAGGTDTIENSALGIAPRVVSQAGTGATAPTLGDEQTAGSASYPWDFATLNAGAYSGVSTYDADLEFLAPVGKPAGTYQSTLTLTLVSK